MSSKYLLLLFCFLFLGSTRILAQQLDWDDNPQIVDYYNPAGDPADPNKQFHRYQYLTPLCLVNANRRCNLDSAFKLFLTNSKFIAPTYGSTEVKDEGILFVRLLLPGFNIPGLHPIKTKIGVESHIVINYTLPGHALHPGMVERRIVQSKDSLYLLTVGTGYSNAGQFLSTAEGNCSEKGQSVLEPLSRLASFFEKGINSMLADMNKNPCIVADVWGPVHATFTSAFKNYINDLKPIIPPIVEDKQPVESNQQPVGGATPEQLGQILLKALKTNDKKLWLACFAPKEVYTQEAFKVESNGESFYSGRFKNYISNFDYLREKLEESGFANLANIKFSRVKFERIQREKGSYVMEGESLIHYFYIEFTYGTEFVGRIGGMGLTTYKNAKYFVGTEAGLLYTARQ